MRWTARAVAAVVTLLLTPLDAAAQNLSVRGQDHAPTALDCSTQPCAEVLPGATAFAQEDGQAWASGMDAGGETVGWVALSTAVVDVAGYSGKPLATLVGLDTDGVIAGARVIHHSEPILLVGIPPEKLDGFVNAYVGLRADQRVVLGGVSAPDLPSVDIVSGATVTVLAESRTILETARLVAQEVGVLAHRPEVPGQFLNSLERWTWAEILDEGALSPLRVTHEQMGVAGGDTAFIDLWFGLLDAPQVGIPLLGENTWRHAVTGLAPGEHLVGVFGNGTSSFRGSGFVRGGLFDRIRVEQGLKVLMFRDLDYKRLGSPPLADAPHFAEAALFIARDGRLDPGASWDFVFLGSAFDYQGGFSRDFHTFRATHRTPRSVYELLGPDPESALWRSAWQTRGPATAAAGTVLVLITLVFVGRRWTSARMARLQRLHTGFLVVAFFGLGLGLSLQPSITQVLTLIGSLVGEWRWSLFLSDPFLFVTWIWIAAVTLVWGRGVFCGWACPYGAASELLFKVGRKLKLPEFELSDPVHERARFLRYAVLLLLVGVFLISPQDGERLAEIEPFKSTFFVAPWTRGFGLFAWWLLLAGASVVWFRPFCRYLCPLGAALALPSSFRLSGPHRREFCSRCNICTRGCEPRAIRKDGSIDPRECLNCWECEANWRDDQVCPPLVKARRDRERKGAA